MFNSKNTKRALLMSVLSLVLCVSMLVGTTFAWFTDSVSSAQNTIQSGNLDVELYYAAEADATTWTPVDANTDVFGYDNWEPGYTKVVYFKVKNNGSLALKYQLSADVYNETPGVNKAGQTFYLSDYLNAAVVDADATRAEILAMDEAPFKTTLAMSAKALAANGAEEIVGFAIWMPTTVGNEANHNGTAPSIEFGINLVATQQTAESDSFGIDYDAAARFAVAAYGYKPVERNTAGEPVSAVVIPLKNPQGGQVGSATFLPASIADDAETLNVTIHETVVNANVTVANDEAARTFEVKADGLKAGNSTKVKVQLTVGAGLTGVTLYHYGNPVPAEDYSYDAVEGVLTFETLTFSPFTVVYDAVAVEMDPDDYDPTVPVALVTRLPEFEGTGNITWDGDFITDLNGTTQALDCVFNFANDEDKVAESIYKDWKCDFFVTLDADTDPYDGMLPANSIVLGGFYGEWGWNGFGNPEGTPINAAIPLLTTFTTPEGETPDPKEGPFTYEGIINFVGEFKCGTGITAGCDAAIAEWLENDCDFIVELRLTNPETGDQIIVNKVVYDFATGDAVITNYPNI